MQKDTPTISNRTHLAAHLGICTKTLGKVIKEAGIHVEPKIMLSGEVIQEIIDAFNNRHKRKKKVIEAIPPATPEDTQTAK